jgi:hypothetical protein
MQRYWDPKFKADDRLQTMYRYSASAEAVMQYTADESIITRSQLLKLPHCVAISSGNEVNFITAVTLSTTAIQFRLLPNITASPILSLIPLDLL